MEYLNYNQAYIAMYIYLHDLQKRTNSADLAEFLGPMSLMPNGDTADSAAWEDWLDAIEKAKDEKNWEIARFKLSR